jgi:predicted dehydrogenase
VDGAEGSVYWTSERPEELWLGHRERANELLWRDPTLQSDAAAAAQVLPAGHAEGFADTFRELYRAVYRAVENGGPPEKPDYPTFADGHDEALIADAIAASAREGRWVAVERAATLQEVNA